MTDDIFRKLWIVSILVFATQVNCYVLHPEQLEDADQSQLNSISADSPVKREQIQQKQVNNGSPEPIVSTSGSNVTAADQDSANQAEVEQYWLNERELFFNLTTFNLSKKTNDLVGEEYGNRAYHLPFWFDYEMFKNLTERLHPDPETALKRHHIYMDNCVNIWKNTALKRLHRPNNFTFIDHAEDWVSFL